MARRTAGDPLIIDAADVSMSAEQPITVDPADVSLSKPMPKKREPGCLQTYWLPMVLFVVGAACLGGGIYGLVAANTDELEDIGPIAINAREPIDPDAMNLVKENPLIGNYSIIDRPNCWRFIDGMGHITGTDGVNVEESAACSEVSGIFGLSGGETASHDEGDEDSMVKHGAHVHGEFRENNTKIAADFSAAGGPKAVVAELEENRALVWPNHEVWPKLEPFAGVEAMGKCSRHDYVAMWTLGGGHEKGSFPQRLSVCGKKAFSMWKGLDRAKYDNCAQAKTGISGNCSSCFGAVAAFGVENCKGACWRGWCKKACLDCTKSYNLVDCVGIPWPLAIAC